MEDQDSRLNEPAWQSFLDYLLDAAFVLGFSPEQGTWLIQTSNAVACDFYGYRPEELVGQSFSLLHQQPADIFDTSATTPSLGASCPLRLEAIHARKDGLRVEVELSLVVVPAGGNDRILATVHDITSYKQRAHQQAQDSIRFHAHLLDSVEQAVIATDLRGRITFWNRYAEELYGWTADEALGRLIVEVTPAPQLQDAAEAIMERLQSGQSWTGAMIVQRKDGTTFPALVTDSPILNASGELIGIVGVSTDLSEHRRAEEAAYFLAAASTLLASSLDYIETLTSLANLAVPYIADWCAIDMVEADGSYQRVAVAHLDPAKVELAWEIERRFGFDPNMPEGAAKVLRTGRPELYSEISDDMLGVIAHNDEHVELLQQVGLRSGMIVPLTVRGQTIGAISLGSSESGRRFGPADLRLAEDLAYRAAMAVDHARLFAAAQAATREAEAAVQARDQFLSIAAHELQTPVTSLYGFAQVLQHRAQREMSSSQRDQRAVQAIAGQAERLSSLIGTLLDVSRIQLGQFDYDRSRVDLGAMVRRIVSEIAPTLDQHTLTVENPTDHVVVDGDALRLEQVIQNLLGNAVKYSPAGGPITVRVSRNDREAIVTVTDCGIGIPPEARDHLFQRFYRAPNVTGTSITGMGIGLYIVGEIIARHGGSVEVASEVGVGSTFTIRLPLAAPQVASS